MERDADDNAMAEGADSIRRARWRQKRWAIPSVLLALLIAAGIAAWFSRESIVDDIIRDQLEANNIPATYTIDHVGGQTQELSNVVLGDPDAPDFTAKRIIVPRGSIGVVDLDVVKYSPVMRQVVGGRTVMRRAPWPRRWRGSGPRHSPCPRTGRR